jgi:hypothetical protein
MGKYVGESRSNLHEVIILKLIFRETRLDVLFVGLYIM